MKRFFFIDCISAYIKIPKEQENCFYVKEPYDLDGISRYVKILSKEGYSIFILDSLSYLLYYGLVMAAGDQKIIKFVNSCRDSGEKMEIIIICNEEDKEKFLVEESLPVFDSIEKLK